MGVGESRGYKKLQKEIFLREEQLNDFSKDDLLGTLKTACLS